MERLAVMLVSNLPIYYVLPTMVVLEAELYYIHTYGIIQKRLVFHFPILLSYTCGTYEPRLAYNLVKSYLPLRIDKSNMKLNKTSLFIFLI